MTENTTTPAALPSTPEKVYYVDSPQAASVANKITEATYDATRALTTVARRSTEMCANILSGGDLHTGVARRPTLPTDATDLQYFLDRLATLRSVARAVLSEDEVQAAKTGLYHFTTRD